MNGRLKNWLRGDPLYFLLELALVIALAASLAYWTWALLAPRALGVSSSAPGSAQGRAAAPVKRELFGSAHAAGSARSSSMPSLRLIGVASAEDAREGHALFAVQAGKGKFVAVGEAVVPGVVLTEVGPDHVVMEREGLAERLGLERRTAPLERQQQPAR